MCPEIACSQATYASPAHKKFSRPPPVEDLASYGAVSNAAHQLLDTHWASLVSAKKRITYFHILFHLHEAFVAYRLPSNSLHLGSKKRNLPSAGALPEIEDLGAEATPSDETLPIPNPRV